MDNTKKIQTNVSKNQLDSQAHFVFSCFLSLRSKFTYEISYLKSNLVLCLSQLLLFKDHSHQLKIVAQARQ